MLSACRKWAVLALVLGALWPQSAPAQIAGTVVPTDANAFPIELNAGR